MFRLFISVAFPVAKNVPVLLCRGEAFRAKGFFRLDELERLGHCALGPALASIRRSILLHSCGKTGDLS
jgi:hypothetical protein